MMRDSMGSRRSELSMRRKLFVYMFLLGTLLLLALVSGLFLLGEFRSAGDNASEALSLQMEFFKKEVSTHFDALAAGSIELSENTAALLDEYFNSSGLSLRGLEDEPRAIAAVQEALMEPLRQRLLQESCSGVFVMLDATVNSGIEGAPHSRTGVYLQQSGYGTDKSVLLFRGVPEVGKAHDITLHRKWRQEFNTELFPNYEQIRAKAALPLSEAYSLTQAVGLPGTTEKAVLMTVPIVGADGSYYGLCGYELSDSCFMSLHAQPANLPRLSFLLTENKAGVLEASAGLSCGVFPDYYRPPAEKLSIESAEHTLLRFAGEEESYVGVMESISLTPNNDPYALSVLMPKADYDRAVREDLLHIMILIALLLFFTVSCCMFFSRRYLQPFIIGLEQIKSHRHMEARSSVAEINDLFMFLAEQDMEHEKSLHALRIEKQSVQRQYEQARQVYEQAQLEYTRAQEELSNAKTQVDRLAYARRNEIDPEDYRHFLNGIHELTKTEREIFECYLDGKTAKDILELFGIKEGTLKFHNHNILNKLGVSSRKQMLRYTALMKQQQEEE